MADFFVGGYTAIWFATGTSCPGITQISLEKGVLSPKTGCAPLTNPSWLCLSPEGDRLYAVSELVDGACGQLATYAVEGDSLRQLDVCSALGASPCHITLDGQQLYLSNYDGGNIVQFTLDESGIPAAPTVTDHTGCGASHPHMTLKAPDGMLLAADLGLDSVFVYRPAGDGLTFVSRTQLAAGCGPRHMAFSRDGSTLFVLCELGSVLCALNYPAMTVRSAMSTLPDGYAGESYSAELALSLDGRTLWVSNRGHDSLTAFDVTNGVRRLGWTDVGGRIPRHFTLTGDGRWLLCACQNSDRITLFSVEGSCLTYAGEVFAPSPCMVLEH